MDKITIYLDFDGVFNIHPDNASTIIQKPYTKSVYLKHKKNVAINSETLNLFKELLGLGCFEVKWLTTWNHKDGILKMLPLLGLDDHFFTIYPDINRRSKSKKEWTEWKSKAIIKDQERNPSPFVWIDDTAPKYWSEAVSSSTKAPHLTIVPERSYGLTKEHILHIVEWLESFKEQHNSK